LNEQCTIPSAMGFSLYRLSETAALYRSLWEMEDYLDGNPNGTYPHDVYYRFLDAVRQTMDNYDSYNDSMCSDEESKTELAEYNSLLRQRKGELVFANTDTDYIDVSVEIMDFKADSVLFEYLDIPSNHAHRYLYDLLTDKSALAGVSIPWEPGDSTIPAPDGLLKKFATRLTLQELQNGQLIYTPETVEYVANLMMIDQTWNSEKSSAFLNSLPGDDCRWFLKKIEAVQKRAAGILEEEPTEPEATEETTEGTGEEATEETTEVEETPKTPEQLRAEALGSMEDTISKTEEFTLNGVAGKHNGGVLLSKNCTTAFDLAYYALNNMWRSVGENDILDDGDETTTDHPYNTTVPERARLRMYWDPAVEMYTFDATNQVIYNGAYIYNSLPLKETVTPVNTPRFMPIDGLGFEKDGVETDRSTYYSTQGFGSRTDGGNYHFTLHASGSFVYYEDQELYFSFLGDDDVYFFIDGKMVMDIGGAHQAAGTDFSLNRDALVKKGLDLKDGEIYSFDMFYAERHTTGSNMRFCTNMHIMDTQTITTKGQYLVETEGQSTVDRTTGMGEPLQENAIRNIGDTVAYSFELLNIRDVAVEELEFKDDSLGTKLSPTEIVLTDPQRTNGALTEIGDISLYYRSYDYETGKTDGSTLQVCSASEMLSMIDALKTEVGKDQPLPEGSYWVTLGAETGVADLQALLAAGVPSMCQLTIYGFRRNMGSEDTPYVNTVVSNCSYVKTENSLVGIQQERISITGSASRMLRVPSMDDLVPPVAQRVQIVLDYGKPVQIPIASLREKIFVVDPVTVGDYVGLITKGANGETHRELTEQPRCQETGDALTGSSGTFTRKGDVLEYRLGKMMSSMEKVLVVFSLGNYSVYAGSQSRVHPYVLLELQLIPATTMYYETDFTTGVFGTEAVGTNLGWEDPKGTANAAEELQNNGYEKDQYPTEADQGEALSGTAAQAPSAPTLKAPTKAAANGLGASVLSGDYVMLDFYDDAAGAWAANALTATLDTQRGVLYGSFGGASDPQIKMSEQKLDYVIKSGDQLRVRIKVKLDAGEAVGFEAFFQLDGNTGYSEDYSIQDDSQWETGYYRTMVLNIPDSYVGKTLNAIRLDPMHGTTAGRPNGTYEIDYMYIGSEADAPDDRHVSTDTLFFDFTNTASDRHRYALPQYGGQNCDTTGWQGLQYIASTSEKSAPYEFAYEADDVHDVVGTVTHSPNVATSEKNSLSIELKGLQYDPHKAEVLQLRVKMNNMVCGTYSPFIRFWYSGGYEEKYHRVNAQNVRDGEFQIITIPLSDAIRKLDSITSIKLGCHEFAVSVDSTVTYDYIYIGPRAGAPVQEALYFDFTDTEEDRMRYENEVYCGHNYDVGNWKGTWREGKGFDSVTHGDGYISVNTNNVGYTYTYVQTGDNGEPENLHYIPDKADVVAIRFKISDTMSVQNSSYVVFNYAKNGKTTYETGQKIPITAGMHPEKGYITLVGKNTTEGILSADYLNGLRVNFYNLVGTGTITIDYIYMGPEHGVPSDEKLFFDFTNTYVDLNRYSSNTYGFHTDYDTNSDKWIAAAGTTKTISKTGEGSITANHMTSTQAIYLETTDGTSSYATKPLNYRPSIGDMVQIRFKMSGLKRYNEFTNLCLYYGVDDTLIDGTNYTSLGRIDDADFDGEYMVLTAALDDSFTSAQLVQSVRVSLNGIVSTDETVPGTLTVDYIYIGQESELPTPRYTVTYQNEAGTVLETQVVHKGEASVYQGATPKKNSDGTYHYTFKSWVTTANAAVNLNNITSNLTLKPSFTAEAHKWKNTVIQEHSCTTNKVIYAVCTVCSYEHTYASEYATGHSFVGGKCTVCGVENEGTLLHFQEGSPELSYDWSTRRQTGEPNFQTAVPGYMTANYNKASTAECYVGMNVKDPKNNIAHKVSTPDEIIQVRLKLTMDQVQELAANSYRVYLHTSDMSGSYDEAHGSYPYSVSVDQGGYTILSFPMPLIAIGNTIEAVRVDFFRGMASVTGLTGTYSIDYIYFGHCCDAPVPQHAWNSGELTKEPTCLEEGERSHTCFYCDATSTSAVGVVDHEYVILKVTASTCNTHGMTEGSWCKWCHKYKSDKHIPQQQPLASHKFVYTDNGDGTHTVTCGNEGCTYQAGQSHSFYYGVCRCGAKEPDHMVYGYDPSYLDDKELSNGTSLFVHGAGVTMNDQQGETGGTYTRGTFSFTGTGFDLISRTGKDQAAIRVAVYSKETMTQDSCVKSLTVYNKGELELYQIPVASVHDLPYGTYYVAIGVNKKIEYTYTDADKAAGKPDLTFLNRGDEFYFDAVRIYDPVNAEEGSDVLQAYKDHSEAYPQITELRDLLLTAEEFGSATDSLIGAIFIDASKDNSGSHISSTIATYKDYGPKNETYLQPGQSVAFKLVVDSPVFPKSLDFGAKTIYGGKAVLEAAVGKAVPNGTTVTGEMKLTRRTTVSATAQFYSLNFTEEDFTLTADGKEYYTYVILTNRAAEGSANVLSVTDIKAAFDTKPAEEEKRSLPATVKYMVDSDAYLVADAYLRGAMEELPADPGMVIRHSLNLASDISVNYLVEKQVLAEYDSFYLECEIPEYEGNSLVGERTVRLQPVERGSYYYFTLDGLTAVHMNDVIRATLRCKKDGWSIDSLTDSYSIGTYAYSQLNKVGVPQELKILCADLLRYGAQAQSYKGYRTNALVDAAMTEAHRAYLSDLEAVSFGNNNRELQDCAAPMVKWAGKALNLD
ncbi:MAG: fibro-slime domain-containing protein, partial [Oscillospiraceae bacterium]|nr:fibro-slime domain-containing protein [Oscillospiraceae bacterium]